MCGIVGIVDRVAQTNIQLDKIRRMMALIKHRGPDGEGVVALHGGVALGHVRLAIIDLTNNAIQPMKSCSGQTTIVYNGEIYNHKQLRQQLIQRGFNFKTQSDTEVLINAYECWGIDFVHQLNGMFAFALYDAKDSSVLLGRDRLGIKPLYYFSNANQLFFGSEIKAVCAAMNIHPNIDAEALTEYLAFQNNYGERTLVEGVKLLPPGSIAKIKGEHTTVYPKRYWEAQITQNELTPSDRREQLAELLNAAVGDQLQADVPVNSFLSGGLDSGAIAAVATNKVGRIKTFTCGFDITNVTQTEQLFDERRRAELMSASIGSEHYEVVLKADDFLSQMAKWAWHAEEPRVGSSFPNYCTSYLASRFTKVCLAGTGADELFGGYPWRYGAALKANSDNEFIQNYYQQWNRMLSKETYQQLAAPLVSHYKFDPFMTFQSHIEKNIINAENSLFKRADAALLFEMETFLHGLLVLEDKASMAHGLETRVPLIDNRLIDFALATPFNEKVNTSLLNLKHENHVYGRASSDMPSFSNGKIILRDILAPHVPTEIAEGRKQGFSPPVETWFRNEMRHWIADEVFSQQAPMAEFLDMRVAHQLWTDHLKGQANNRLFIWGMIALHLFVTEFLRSRFGE